MKVIRRDFSKMVIGAVAANGPLALLAKSPLDTPKRTLSFLLIGQSNMAGRGHFNEVPPIGNNRCKMLRMGRWQPMSEPINPDRAVFGKDFHSGISLGASFADSAAKKFNREIGLIPCADGGTRLDQWMPGEALFDHAVAMAGFAKRSSELGGVLWHQGESDCQLRGDDYFVDLAKMMTELRRQLGNPNLPIVFGELSEHPVGPTRKPECFAVFNKKLAAFCAKFPHCALVKAAELPLQSDGIHFSAGSLRVLGQRYFEAFETIR